MIVYRGMGSELVVELKSDEELGRLDTHSMEDYYGTEGQLSMHHLVQGTRYAILMEPQPELTPEVAHDRFKGALDIFGLPSGSYRVEGLVRDVNGNFTVLADHHAPPPGARVTTYEFTLEEGLPFPPSRTHFMEVYAPRLAVVDATPVWFEVHSQLLFNTPPTPALMEVVDQMFVMPQGGAV